MSGCFLAGPIYGNRHVQYPKISKVFWYGNVIYWCWGWVIDVWPHCGDPRTIEPSRNDDGLASPWYQILPMISAKSSGFAKSDGPNGPHPLSAQIAPKTGFSMGYYWVQSQPRIYQQCLGDPKVIICYSTEMAPPNRPQGCWINCDILHLGSHW